MSEFITENTEFPDYYQFPAFLLKVPVSQTARLAYMVLYNRARLSAQNGWVEDGRVYVFYPIENLAKLLDRSPTSIKQALKELEGHSLLVRQRQGIGRANLIYIRLPEPEGCTFPAVGNLSTGGTENCPSHGQKTVRHTGGKLSGSNKKESEEKSHKKGVRDRRSYGRYENIFLTEEEYAALNRDYPGRLEGLIESMSGYLKSVGKTYKDYGAALRTWAARDAGTCRRAAGSGIPEYRCEEGESL